MEWGNLLGGGAQPGRRKATGQAVLEREAKALRKDAVPSKLLFEQGTSALVDILADIVRRREPNRHVRRRQ